jgi:hypothetical protein
MKMVTFLARMADPGWEEKDVDMVGAALRKRGIRYIVCNNQQHFPNFIVVTGPCPRDVIEDFISEGVTYHVLDLEGNPGLQMFFVMLFEVVLLENKGELNGN